MAFTSVATLQPSLIISAAAQTPATNRRLLKPTPPPLPETLTSSLTTPTSIPPKKVLVPIATSTLTTPTSIPPKKVLVPIAFGTEEMEAVILVDVLRRAGADVILASVEPQLEVEGFGGTRLIADAFISECSDQVFDLVALPGGMPGSARLRDCNTLQNITRRQAEEKRLYGAICAAPAVTLLPWGLLKRKQTTCHPAFMDKLPTFWAVKTNLQVSGELTTSRGPGTSLLFSISLVEQLFGESAANEAEELLVLLPIANGSEEIEVVTVTDVLRRAKVDVVVASVEKSLQILASRGTRIVADKFISNAAESIFDLIILPGGIAGAERLHKSRILKKLLKKQESAGRKYGAISYSPTILKRQGLLKGKRATAHPSVISELDNPAPVGAQVVVDGRIITCRGLSSAVEFALTIVAKFFGHSRARSVAEGLVFKYPRC